MLIGRGDTLFLLCDAINSTYAGCGINKKLDIQPIDEGEFEVCINGSCEYRGSFESTSHFLNDLMNQQLQSMGVRT